MSSFKLLLLTLILYNFTGGNDQNARVCSRGYLNFKGTTQSNTAFEVQICRKLREYKYQILV